MFLSRLASSAMLVTRVTSSTVTAATVDYVTCHVSRSEHTLRCCM